MLCGLPGSLLTLTAMLALSAVPPPVGVNVTETVQLECGDTELPHVPPVTVKSLPFAPLILSLSDSENPDKLVTVTFSVLVGVFDVSVP
jgi:hypothetical protein